MIIITIHKWLFYHIFRSWLYVDQLVEHLGAQSMRWLKNWLSFATLWSASKSSPRTTTPQVKVGSKEEPAYWTPALVWSWWHNREVLGLCPWWQRLDLILVQWPLLLNQNVQVCPPAPGLDQAGAKVFSSPLFQVLPGSGKKVRKKIRCVVYLANKNDVAVVKSHLWMLSYVDSSPI